MKLLQLHEPGQTPHPHDEPADTSPVGMAVGIDLGTTHSLVAVALGGRAIIIPGADGTVLLPSAVTIEGVTLRSFKRLMGKRHDEVKALPGWAFDPTVTEGHVGLAVTADHRITPIELSAHILRCLKERAETFLETPVTQAVITVPAYFDAASRQATAQAAELAGLKVLRLLSEPTASAVAYGLDRAMAGTYLVYDLGGGTFDVSLLRFEQGIFRVLGTAGDTHLGGDDIDAAIVHHWGVAASDTALWNSYKLMAKQAKEALCLGGAWPESLTDDTPQNKTADALPPGLVTPALTNADLERLTAPFLERTLKLCREALNDCHLTLSDLEGVILVGGATKMPFIVQGVEAFYGGPLFTHLNPEHVVAMGAALQAQALHSGEGEHVLLDVLPLALGLETMGGLVEKIIDRNTPIPCAKAQEFTTYQDGQTALKLHVVQGEREEVKHCRSLAQFSLNGIPPMVAGSPRIRVTFQVDADGLLTVSAQETLTDHRQEIQVHPTYGLTEEDLRHAVEAGFVHAQEDMTQRLLIEQRVEAERTLLALEAALAQDGGLLTPSEIAAIVAHQAAVQGLLSSPDRAALRAALEDLDAATETFAERRLNATMAKALKGKKVSDVGI